jgi:hypothetical protein
MALSATDRDNLKQLRSRGMQISAKDWQNFNRSQQQDILRQSNKITRVAQQTPEQRRANARRRADYYSKKAPVERLDDWPDDESSEFWLRYRENMGYTILSSRAA